jgi:hypothetical protein
MSQVRAIERSLRCFVYSLFGLIPGLGLGPALIALFHFRKAVSEAAGVWNPARRYLYWGFWLAGFGIFLSLATFVGVILRILGLV